MTRKGYTFTENMEKVWGDRWRVTSEIGTLRAVLMRRPGKELENIKDPAAVFMRDFIDVEKARWEHDTLAQIYRDHGVEVYYVEEMSEDTPNAMFCHDLILGTPEGVIAARPGIEIRAKEVKYAAQAAARIGVPIVKTIHGEGVFDGACVTWVDEETVIIGTGTRCNRAGYEQAVSTFRDMGVKNFISLSIARNQNHLDGFLSIVDRDVAVTYPYITPDIIYEELEKRGFRFVEIPAFEEKINFAANSVALEPGKIVMPTGAPRTVELLEKAGVQVIEIELDEIKKGGGAVHCLTAFLKRDDIPVYQVE
ncbi:dimethylarginine dimethylaminohydrolase family protein [Bacilliculturomica massiliensis]|uniref:dimethylarginine dimethylaminohydrolase family protein n=1 Tax=Bacilliculturomica massiliensis TaxID=1917867 RepID=UPI00102F4AED|nr:arginine deiminase family protein [Bacilliculturomica massiliensis]